MANESFADLIDKILRQAAKSITDERRGYISSLISNIIFLDDIEHYESKHLLRILYELNNIGITWMRFYLNFVMGTDAELRETQNNILNLVVVSLVLAQEKIDKSILQNSYKEHLVSLGLLEKDIEIDKSSQVVKLKTKGYKITSLGSLLHREIGFSNERLG